MITDNELKIKLNLLKKIGPSASWRDQNRSLLLNQIYHGQAVSKPSYVSSLVWPVRAFTISYRYAMLSVFMLIVLLGGGLTGLEAAKKAKPGDLLYLAKIMKEKTRLSLTFDNKEKAKLGIEFATNRVNELSAVLAEPSDATSKDKVEKLVTNAQEELSAVRSRIGKIDTVENKVAVKPEEPAAAAPTKAAEDNTEEFFSANSGKDDKKLDYAVGSNKIDTGIETVKPADQGAVEAPVSTSTPGSTEATSTPAAEVNSDPKDILDQAQDLLSKDDYSATLNKIDEASQVIGQVGGGEVKGESENASSSAEIVPADVASSTEKK